MQVERLTIPEALPFDLAEIAGHLRIDESDEVQLAINMGRAAAAEIEAYAQIAVLNQTIKQTEVAWPDEADLALAIGPVLPGAPVTVIADGAAFTGFELVAGLRPVLHLTGAAPEGRIVVTYEAGFGTEAADVPADLRHAILDQAAALFDLRGAGDGKSNGLSPHMARVAARFRRVKL